MSRQDDLKKLIIEYTRRLQKLKERQARKGIDTEPHILVEIEDIEATIEKLQAELARPGFTLPEPVAPAKVRSARSPVPKPAPLSRDPTWQMLGVLVAISVLVAIIGVAWPVYTFYASGNILATPAPTPNPSMTIATVAAISTGSIPIVNSPTSTLTNTPPLPENEPAPAGATTTPQTSTASDGAPMVLVPAGPFKMGSNDLSWEQPVHEVTLAAFYIDQYEVTNALYRRCVEGGGCEQPACLEIFEAEAKKNHPVVCVNWDQAKTYCEWRGGRLPTEAEWEKAARGTDGRTYPWGDTPPDGTLLNFDDNIGDTTPIGSYPDGVSPYGVYDMAGNVWEWVADWYDDKYYSNSPAENPPGPPNGDAKVLRGGAWYSNNENYVRASSRPVGSPDSQQTDRGFRCVAAAP
jgi:formylglycine-generating enzyme required for sulfatase activity